MEDYLVPEQSSIKAALSKIQKNHSGTVFAHNSAMKVIGSVTDGDIRRWLLEGGTIDDPLSSVVNFDFFWVNEGATRSEVIKNFDLRIRCLPVLKAGILVAIIGPETLPSVENAQFYSSAKSPVRISFGGGGSDLTYYFQKSKGAILSATINLFSRATLRVLGGEEITIRSLNLGRTFKAKNLEEGLINSPKELETIFATLSIIKPKFGFELMLEADFPIGSGLGGSSSVVASVLGAFNEFRDQRWSKQQLVELTYEVERIHLGNEGGWQDQYAAIYGGFNFIEFTKENQIVLPLQIQKEAMLEFESRLFLCNTNICHVSHEIHADQREHLVEKLDYDPVQRNVELCYEMRNSLVSGDFNGFGKRLDQSWKIKQTYSPKISSPELQLIYETAVGSGASGGKLLGAGGGGFFLFFVEPFEKIRVREALGERGLDTFNFNFESDGLVSWKTKEEN